MWAILGKIIDATGFEKLPKVQLIAQFGHTDCMQRMRMNLYYYLVPLMNASKKRSTLSSLNSSVRIL